MNWRRSVFFEKSQHVSTYSQHVSTPQYWSINVFLGVSAMCRYYEINFRVIDVSTLSINVLTLIKLLSGVSAICQYQSLMSQHYQC